ERSAAERSGVTGLPSRRDRRSGPRQVKGSRGEAPGAHYLVLRSSVHMPFRFFTVPIQDDGRASGELNAFLQSHRTLAVDRRWVDEGASSFWSFCIDYLDGTPGASAGGRGAAARNRIDYKEVLSPEQFGVFVRLRDLRREIAQAEGVPVYTV